MLELFSLTLDAQHFSVIGACHLIIAALHGCVLLAASFSIAGRLLLPRRLRDRLTSMTIFVATRLVGNPGEGRRRPLRLGFLAALLGKRLIPPQGITAFRRARSLYGVLFAKNGFFGIEGNQFEALFLCREVVETALQTAQAYKMSRLLPRAWLNRVYVPLLVVNCWSTSVVQCFYDRNVVRQRLVFLLSDILLGIVSAIGMPVILAVEYFHQYDPQISDFPYHLWYNDAWFVRIVNDAPLILFGSWFDVASRIFYSISMLAALSDVRDILNSNIMSRAQVQPEEQETDRSWLRRDRIIRRAHRVLLCVGVGVLALYLEAESRPSPSSCVLEVRPWGVRNPACALIEINCHTSPSLTGDAADFTAIVGKIDALSLAHLAIRHCPHVEITSRFEDFENLITLKIYNSTVVS